MTDKSKEKATPTLQDALREGLKKLPHDQQKHAREVLKAKGVLKEDPHAK